MWNQFIFVVGLLLQLLIVIGLFRRRLYLHYPVFTVYISFYGVVLMRTFIGVRNLSIWQLVALCSGKFMNG
jgi:hypothetical protein